MRLLLPSLILAAALPTQPASAQTKHKGFAPQHDAQTQKILDAQLRNELAAAKTSAQKARLKGYSYRQLGQPVIDSASFHYTGTRGSDSLKNAIWDEYYNEWGVIMPSGKHRASADSIVNWAPAGSGLQIESTLRYQHDAGTNILSSEQRYTNGAPCTKYTNTYTPAGLQLTRVTWQQSGACGQYVPFSWATYNSAGSILTDSSVFAKVSYGYLTGGTTVDSFLTTYANSTMATGWKYARGKYTYNSTGLLLSFEGRFFDSLRTSSQVYLAQAFTYDAQGRVDSTVQWNGPTTSAPEASWKYAYTGTFRRATGIRQYALSSGSPILIGRWGYHLNSVGNWDTVYFYNVSGGVDALIERDPVIYTADGFINYVSGYYYNASTGTYSPTPYDRNQYYYETYDDGLKIGDTNKTSVPALAYPVPFTNVLNVVVHAAWTCFDAQGRMVAQGVGPVRVETARWAPGLYVLRSAENAVRIVKQ